MALEQVGADVRIKGARKAARDAKGVARGIDDIGDEAGRASRKIAGMNTAGQALGRNARSLAAGLGLLGAAAGGMAFVVGRHAVGAASDLGEEINKTNVVFRGSEKDILQWSKATADGLGISRREALQSAGVFGNMLVPMGVARDRAGQMSTRLVELAADMSSFNNASPEETLEALGAGIAGESEPLRRFGVDIRDAALNTFALEKGIKKTTLQMSSAEKTQILYAKILSDTKDAQGDFVNTSNELPNLQRRIRANTENLSAAFGKGLEPAVKRAAKGINDLIVDITPAARKIGEAASDILYTDLSPGEKAARLFDVSKAELSPVLRPLLARFQGEFGRVDAGKAVAAAIERGAPVMADALAAQVPNMARAFVSAFAAAGPGGQLLTVGLLAAKFGAFSTVGGLVAQRLGRTFRASASTGALAGDMEASGRRSGKIFGAAMALMMVPVIRDALVDAFPDLERYSGSKGWGNLARDLGFGGGNNAEPSSSAGTRRDARPATPQQRRDRGVPPGAQAEANAPRASRDNPLVPAGPGGLPTRSAGFGLPGVRPREPREPIVVNLTLDGQQISRTIVDTEARRARAR